MMPREARRPAESRFPSRRSFRIGSVGLPVGVSIGLSIGLGLSVMAGCAVPGRVMLDPPPRTNDPNRAPADFSLGVTVFQPRERGPLPEPTRFVLEADGILRAAMGEGASGQTFPLRTRRLSRDEVDQLFRLSRDAGLFERPTTDDEIALSNAAATIQTSHRLGPAAGGIVVTASVSGAGERLHHGFQSGTRGAMNPLVDELSRLVWADGR